MKIYIDILFLEYLIINYFLIEITGVLIREKSKWQDKLLAASITSAYSIFVIVNHLHFATSTICKLILAAVIVLISYRPRDAADVIQKTITLYVVTYFLGGIMTSVIYKITDQHMAMFLSILIGSFLFMIFKAIMKSRIKKSNYTCNIKIQINEEIIMAKALIDSGHDLQDTITGDTVVIIKEDKIEEISETLFAVLSGGLQEVPSEFETKIRMITYTSLGNTNDVLYGVKADSVIAYYDGLEIKNKNVVVAMTQNVFKEFDAIIGLNLIEGGYVIGNSSIIKVKS
ncbi:MAG: sigma-E processing peptidase SpoIIGA [Clostridia bacterium]|nr:sigma-E processing peptidase SpoIIGA [Clostridia bacterium]